jgi:hypothetical protein
MRSDSCPARYLNALFKSEVDEAADFLAVPDRNLPGDERRNAHWLKRGQKVSDAAVCLVDPVDEDQMGDAELVEHPESRRGKRRACRIWVHDDDRQIGCRDRARTVGGKADRARGHRSARTRRRDI